MGVGNSNSALSRVSSHPFPGRRSQAHQGLRDLFSRVSGIVTLFCRIPGLFAPTGLDVQDKVSGRRLIRVIEEAPGFVIALPCRTVELMTAPTANIRNSWHSFIERVHWGPPVLHYPFYRVWYQHRQRCGCVSLTKFNIVLLQCTLARALAAISITDIVT